MGKSGNKIYSSHEQRRLLSFNLYSSYTEAILDTTTGHLFLAGSFILDFLVSVAKLTWQQLNGLKQVVSRGGVSYFIYDSSEGIFSQRDISTTDFQLFEYRRSSVVEMTNNGAENNMQ